MKNRVKFGLLGSNISYSFSQKYFTEKFKLLRLENHYYEIFDMPNLDSVSEIFSNPEIKGLNVTIPYKEKIIPFLDELSDEAREIEAVNTIKKRDGKLIGYNTDAFGFEKTLLLYKKDFHQKAMILGDGGVAKAVKFILKKYNIPFVVVSRKSEVLNFENLSRENVSEHQIIIQCTPVGTFPNITNCLSFPFDALTNQHLAIDLIYNPPLTTFLKIANEKGAKCVNGYYMLEQQAEKSWEIWKY